jgi:hypothetical protein
MDGQRGNIGDGKAKAIGLRGFLPAVEWANQFHERVDHFGLTEVSSPGSVGADAARLGVLRFAVGRATRLAHLEAVE